MLRWLLLSLLVIVFDQITKYLADNIISEQGVVHVLPYFNLTLAYNEGAAFSFLADAGGWQRWFLTGLALIVSLVLVSMIKALDAHEKWQAISLSLILGGAIGNVIDRIIHGHVIDFLDVYYQEHHWPAFNIADSAISIGVAMLLIEMVFFKTGS
jgi:signal peptidase II